MEHNYAAYTMIDMSLTSKLKAIVGLRYEHFTQKINLADPVVTDPTSMQNYNTFNPAINYPQNDTNASTVYPPYREIGNITLVNTTKSDLLPYLTMIYGVTDKTNLRFSLNQSLTRTKEQELIPLNLLNQFTGTRNIGNPSLTRTKITHFDLRFETFPTGTEIMSASLFYKYFNNPAEASLISSAAGDGYLSTFTNQKSAMVAGIEIEFRRRIGSLLSTGGILDRLTLYTNLSFMQSRVDVASVSPLEIFDNEKRSLQGQANYVINAGLIFSEPKTNISFAMFYNRVGQRISLVSNDQNLYPNIYELARY